MSNGELRNRSRDLSIPSHEKTDGAYTMSLTVITYAVVLVFLSLWPCVLTLVWNPIEFRVFRHVSLIERGSWNQYSKGKHS